MENFESRHRRKKDYLDEETKIVDLYALERNKLIMIAYRQNRDKKTPKERQQYFILLHQYNKENLIKEITVIKKSHKQKYWKKVWM